MEHLPRLTAARTPSPNSTTQVPHPAALTSLIPLPSSSPSKSILEARMTKRKRSHLSEDQDIFKPSDSLLHSLVRVHKRAISVPHTPQNSASTLARIATSLPRLTSGHFEPTASPPLLSMSHQRTGSEQSQWVRPNESSPVLGIPSRSPPRQNLEGNRILSSNDLQAHSQSVTPQSDPKDRVLAACRRFRRVDVDQPLEGGDICMQVENCTTGSVPRKVISHLFGRNKVCTRRIPERVWVCMCRKHYQRVRYRKGADFSVTQIGMVYEQIVRMIFWSRGLESPSRINREAITIRSWTFSIRKRELRRLVDTSGRDLIPRWIIQSLGDGKTHDDILDIVERLHHEIQQGMLKDVPPVEFLPEVVDAHTNVPAQLSVHVSHESSNDIRMATANRTGRLGQRGEAAESPMSFVKESSPLEPVQEEGSLGDRSSEELSSPTLSAPYDASNYERQPGNHPQRHEDDLPKPNTAYPYVARSPQVDSGMASYVDRRGTLSHYDSQNPTLPSMRHFGINHQMQAPVNGPRGSHDNVSHALGVYADTNSHGPNAFALTDRSSSTSMSNPTIANDGEAVHATSCATLCARDGHNIYATTADYQAPPTYHDSVQRGNHAAPPGWIEAGGQTYSEAFAFRPGRSANDRDATRLSSMHNGYSNAYIPPLQTLQHVWHHAEADSNSEITPTTNRMHWHPSAYDYGARHAVLRQHPSSYVHTAGSDIDGEHWAPQDTGSHGQDYYLCYGSTGSHGETRFHDRRPGSHQHESTFDHK
ncbi:hypothetical protein FZEAL_6592 [Fusarium zealandicum]|uniref:Uncharacterized protein n=1 Tax=Fusarium zealandicum TaxID=1053134 RepID=A0A8H4UHS1_9HYPO|nr:hypothetical protein FZEAL_6592 [Fusarium zealandicum]